MLKFFSYLGFTRFLQGGNFIPYPDVHEEVVEDVKEHFRSPGTYEQLLYFWTLRPQVQFNTALKKLWKSTEAATTGKSEAAEVGQSRRPPPVVVLEPGDEAMEGLTK